MEIMVKVVPREEDSTNVCTLCPVAQALRAAVGLERGTPQTVRRIEAFAQPERLYARGHEWMIAMATPPDVAARLKRWDATGKMEPFSFPAQAVPSTTPRPHLEWIHPGAGHLLR